MTLGTAFESAIKPALKAPKSRCATRARCIISEDRRDAIFVAWRKAARKEREERERERYRAARREGLAPADAMRRAADAVEESDVTMMHPISAALLPAASAAAITARRSRRRMVRRSEST